MHKDGPVTRLPIHAVPGKQPGLRVFLLMLGASILCAAALAAPAPKDKPAAAPAKETAPAATFVGADTCASCHEEVVKGFANNPHTKMVLMHGDKGVTCENCHGAGSEHVAGGGDITKIFNPAKASAQAVDAKCLGCHAGAHPNFDRSPHAKAGVSCISCHDIHGKKDADHLLKASQPALCYQCHADVKAAFNLPFHHPVNEGVVKCTDCHDVHGAFQPNNLTNTADQSLICVKCHMDKRGPFVFEHMPVKAEGCQGCHSTPPHGSVNPRMLAMPNINVLCNQCHSQVSADTVHGMGAGSTDSVPCTSCHTYIHGSNVQPAFLR